MSEAKAAKAVVRAAMKLYKHGMIHQNADGARVAIVAMQKYISDFRFYCGLLEIEQRKTDSKATFRMTKRSPDTSPG